MKDETFRLLITYGWTFITFLSVVLAAWTIRQSRREYDVAYRDFVTREVTKAEDGPTIFSRHTLNIRHLVWRVQQIFLAHQFIFFLIGIAAIVIPATPSTEAVSMRNTLTSLGLVFAQLLIVVGQIGLSKVVVEYRIQREEYLRWYWEHRKEQVAKGKVKEG